MPAKPAILAAISAPLFAVATLAAVAGAIATSSESAAPICAEPGKAPAASEGLTTEQLANARIIAQVGVNMGVPMPGETIAIATAMQESNLQNLNYGDRDSLGLFQQRPSQGWGSPERVTDPVYAATSFYKALLQIPGWRSMPTTEAAQAVQQSAFPDAYGQWAPQASALAAEFTGNLECLPAGSGDNTVAAAAVNAAGYRIPAGTPAPIVAVITFALAQLGKPYVYGATGPNAYDCSGLVQAAYARIGVHLPRTTFDQVNVGGAVYSVDQLQPGDLIFIPGSDGTPQTPGHVGMYVGQGLLIQAPETGQVVKLSPLTQWAGSIAAMRHLV